MLDFRNWCITIGNLPSSYVDSLSYEEQIIWLCKYIKDNILPEIVATKEEMKKYDQLITDLNNKVDKAYSDMEENIVATVTEIINRGIEQGLFNIGLTYNEPTEELNIILEGSV